MRKNLLKIFAFSSLVIIFVTILTVPISAATNGYILSLTANGILDTDEYFRIQTYEDGAFTHIHVVEGPREMDYYDISVNTLEYPPQSDPQRYTVFYKFHGTINVVWYDDISDTRIVVPITEDFQVVDLGNVQNDFNIEFIHDDIAELKISSFQLVFGDGVLVDDDAANYWNGYTDGYDAGYNEGYRKGLNENNPIVSMFTDPIGALFDIVLYETDGFVLSIGGIFFTIIGILLFVAFLRYFAGG